MSVSPDTSRFQSLTAAPSVTVPTHHLTVNPHSPCSSAAGMAAFHKVSLKHLQRYLEEFGYKFNNRKAPDLFGVAVARMAKVGAMPYAQLVEEDAFTPFVRKS
jgi:hypothetical protein